MELIFTRSKPSDSWWAKRWDIRSRPTVTGQDKFGFQAILSRRADVPDGERHYYCTTIFWVDNKRLHRVDLDWLPVDVVTDDQAIAYVRTCVRLAEAGA